MHDQIPSTFKGHLSNIVGCKFSPDSALLVTASWDTKVNIWDSNSGQLKQSLCHVIPPPQLVFSPHIRALSLNKFFTAISTGLCLDKDCKLLKLTLNQSLANLLSLYISWNKYIYDYI